MPTIALTQQNFAQAKASRPLVLVDVWAPWCGPCKQFKPIFESVSNQHPTVLFGTVDAEAQPDLAEQLGVQSVPTIQVYKNGQLVQELKGVLPASSLSTLVSTLGA